MDFVLVFYIPIQLTNVQDRTHLVFLALQKERTTKNTFLYVIDNLSNTFVPFMSTVFNISINFIYKNHKNNKLHHNIIGNII